MGARTSRASQGLPLTLVMARDGYQVDSNQYRGRQSAGASFLEAYLNFSGNNSHHLVVPHEDEGEWFHQAATAVHADARTEAVGFNHWGDAASRTGAIHVPDPCINDWAWKRMPWGDGSFSLIGIVHTLCSRNVQHALGQYTSAPVRPWDALICTSQAARSVVEGFLEARRSGCDATTKPAGSNVRNYRSFPWAFTPRPGIPQSAKSQPAGKPGPNWGCAKTPRSS